MFGIGTTEILVILVVALIILGPKSLPKVARTLGKGLAEFRKVSTDFQRTINTEIELEEREKRKKDAEKRLNKKAADAETDTQESAPQVEDPTGELATAPDSIDEATNVAADASSNAPLSSNNEEVDAVSGPVVESDGVKA